MDLWSKYFLALHQGHIFIPGSLLKRKNAAPMDALKLILREATDGSSVPVAWATGVPVGWLGGRHQWQQA
jgi:hypothetical protein